MDRRAMLRVSDRYPRDGQVPGQQNPFVWGQPPPLLQQQLHRSQHDWHQQRQGSCANPLGVDHSAVGIAAATPGSSSGDSSSHCQDVYARVSQYAAAHDLATYLGHAQDLDLDLDDLDLDNLDLDNIPLSVLGGSPASDSLQDRHVSSRRDDLATSDTCQVSKDTSRFTMSRGSSSGSNEELMARPKLLIPAAALAAAELHHLPSSHHNVVGMTAVDGCSQLMPAQLSITAAAAHGSSMSSSRQSSPTGHLQVSPGYEQQQQQQQLRRPSHQSSTDGPSPPVTPAAATAGLTAAGAAAAIRSPSALGESHAAHQQQQQQPWVAAWGGSHPATAVATAVATASAGHNLIRQPLSQPPPAPQQQQQQQQQHVTGLPRPGLALASDRLIAPAGATMQQQLQQQSLQHIQPFAVSGSGRTSANSRLPSMMLVPQEQQQQKQQLHLQHLQHLQQEQLREQQQQQIWEQQQHHHQHQQRQLYLPQHRQIQRQQQQQVPIMGCDHLRPLLPNRAAAGSSNSGTVGQPEVTSPEVYARAHIALQQRLQAAYQAGFSDGAEYVKQHNRRGQVMRQRQQQQPLRQETPGAPATSDTPPAAAPAATGGGKKRRLSISDSPAECQHKKMLAAATVVAAAGSSTAAAATAGAASSPAAVENPSCDLGTAVAAGPPAAAKSAPVLCELLASDRDSAAAQLRNMSDSELLLLAAQAVSTKLAPDQPSDTNRTNVGIVLPKPRNNLPSARAPCQEDYPHQPGQQRIPTEATSDKMYVDQAIVNTHTGDGTYFSSVAATLVQQLMQHLQKSDDGADRLPSQLQLQ